MSESVSPKKKKSRVISEKRILKYIEDKHHSTSFEYRTTKRLHEFGEMPESRVHYLAGYLDGLQNLRQDIIEGVIWKGGEIK